MATITWDAIGSRYFETGVDHGVLYIQSDQGAYDEGYAWNGLTTITESPSGAESSPQYADNIKYLNLVSAEEFGATVEAFTYPDEFAQCDGTAVFNGGVAIGQQSRRNFGLAYRTLIGNDIVGTEYGYKLHLIYGAQAAPSERANTTVNDSPEAVAFSWELTTTPVNVGTIGGKTYKPTASLTVNSTKVPAANLAALELILFGSAGVDPRLPLPAEVIALFDGTLTQITTTITAPTSTAAGLITIPTTTGVNYTVDGVIVTGTYQIPGAIGSSKIVVARPKPGYVFSASLDNDWQFTKTA